MEMILSCTIGVVIGILTSYFFRKRYTLGNLRIDHSDEDDEPYIFLEMDSSFGGLNRLIKQKYVVLNVVVKNYISHK